MLVAQALGEYAGVAGLVSAITNASVVVESYVRQIEPSTWGFAALAALLVWFFFGRSR